MRFNTLSGLAFCLALIFHSVAQAQNSMTVYGRIVIGVIDYSGNSALPGSTIKESGLGSRLGFKGNEDLGDGLNAIYQLEAGFNPDTGSGGIISREASVGLLTPYGRIKLGFMLTPLDDLHGIVGPGYLSNVTNDNLNGFWANGYNNSFTGANGDGSAPCTEVAGPNGNGNTFAFDNRYGNSLRYDTPNLGGFSFATHLALGELAQNADCHSYAWSSKLQYKTDKIVAAIAYNLHHQVRGLGLDDHIVLLALGANIGDWANISAYAQKIQYSNGPGNALTQNGFGLRGQRYYGQHTVELAWYRGGDGKGDQTPVFSGIYTGAQTQSDLYILGYRYDLSRRSQLWFQYAMLDNGARSAYQLGGATSPLNPAVGQSARAIGVGIKHDF